MKVLATLVEHGERNGVKLLVIGGHALNVLGYRRQTGDLDLLVSKTDRSFWSDALLRLKYKSFQSHEVFERFEPGTIAEWPVDLMFVDSTIFKQLCSEAVLGDFGTVIVGVPSVRHMIALKLHALKQRQSHREEKDLSDVRELLKLNVVESDEFRQLCEKYDRLDVFTKLANEKNI